MGNPWMWTGQRYDSAVGLYAFLARTYRPRTECGFVHRVIRPRWSRPDNQRGRTIMTDPKNTNQSEATKLPSHVAYQVRDREG